MKKFYIGQHLHCSSPYGGELCIEILNRTNQVIFYRYTEECTDQYLEQHAALIVAQPVCDPFDPSVILDMVETIEAWDYEGFKAYYWADQSIEDYIPEL